MTSPQAIEIVVAAAGDATLVWDAAGTMHVATDAESVGRWVCDLAASPTTPRVAFAREATMLRLAHLALDRLGAPSPAIADVSDTGVHVLVLVVDRDGDSVCTVWPPSGPPQARRGAAAMGGLLVDIAADKAQPRVPAGPPPSPVDRLLERGVAFLGAP